ncbi:MAG TPA: ABC transporter substrate-binding protein [Firmicutes bacterium]|nr:ABC transporter substrate-binding protein [Bacillota bacterium]
MANKNITIYNLEPEVFKLKRIIFLLALCLAGMLLAGCAPRPAATPAEPPAPVTLAAPAAPAIKVYTTFYPLYDFAGKIGGERAEVAKLVPPGVSPHDWEPDPGTLSGLKAADLLLYNGLGLEPWLDKVVGALETTKLIPVNTTEGIEPLRGVPCGPACTPDEEEKKKKEAAGELPDPHVWLDPLLALKQAERILESFVAADPDSEQYYRANFAVLKGQFEQLDAEYREALQGKARDKFIVTHLSFAYLAERYGLKQVGIAGLSPQAEPTARELAELVELIRAYGIRYIFQEPLVSPRLAQMLAAETGAGILEINPLEGLLPEEISAGKDYFSVMRENLVQLYRALE